MYRNMAQLYRNNQIIDVTKECTFEWVQEPSSCYAFLEVSGASGDFTDGETVTGGTSNATATVFSSYVDGGRVYVENVSGTFEAGETITGSSSNQTATVDGFVAERSYTSTPNNITHGTFPDSIISKDIDDYLEWESTLTGSGFVGKLKIFFPESGLYIIPYVMGFGIDVNGKNVSRYFRYSVCRDYIYDGEMLCGASGLFNGIPPTRNLPCAFANITSLSAFAFLTFYQQDKGTFRWRIYNIRVLKLVI